MVTQLVSHSLARPPYRPRAEAAETFVCAIPKQPRRVEFGQQEPFTPAQTILSPNVRGSKRHLRYGPIPTSGTLQSLRSRRSMRTRYVVISSITNSTVIAKKGQPSGPLVAFKLSCRKTNEQRRAMKTSSSWVYTDISKNRQKPFQIDRLCEMKVASCQLCILLVLLLAPAR